MWRAHLSANGSASGVCSERVRSDGGRQTAVKKARSDEAALRKARMLIGGKWVESASGEVLEVEDPAHRRPVARSRAAALRMSHVQ